jgi:predicted transcriptional regulator
MNPEHITFRQAEFSKAVKEKIFSTMLKEKRRIGLREFSKRAGVSSATLSRVANGKPPDIETFFKICWWMKVSCNKFYKHES